MEQVKKIKELSEIIIQELKNMAHRGEYLTPESMSRALANRPEIKVFLDVTPEDEPQEEAESGPRPEEVEALSSQLEMVASRQEGEPPQPLRVMEDQAAQREDFLRRALLAIIRLMPAAGDKNLRKAVGALKEALLSDANLDDLEVRLQAIHEAAFKAGSGQDKAKPVSTWIRMLKKPDSTDQQKLSSQRFLPQIKQIFLGFVSEFDLDLGQDYLKRLAGLRRRIDDSQDLEQLLSLTPEIAELIRSYGLQIYEERKKAASFVAEVGQRLAEMENHLLASVSQTREFQQANNDFASALTAEIDSVSGSIRVSQHLEELKSLVLSKLANFKTAIEHKRREDEIRLEHANRDLNSLQRKFKEARQEVSRSHQENQALQRKLHVDFLTGAFNRLAYDQRVAEEMERFRRYQRVFSLIVFDVDDFKRVNDTYGHSVGDRCLKEIAQKVRPLLRKTDFLARYGGDEFVILLPETGRRQSREVAEKIRQEIELTDFLFRSQKVPVTISLGVTRVEPSDQNPETVFNRADQAFYKAKKEGPNRVEVM